MAGVEPAILCLEGTRVIHCATWAEGFHSQIQSIEFCNRNSVI